MKTIRRIFLFGAMVGATSFANAQSAPKSLDGCDAPPKAIVPKIKWDARDLKVVTTETVRDIMTVREGGAYHNDPKKSFYATLGLYKSFRSMTMQPSVTKIVEGNGKTCYRLNDITLTIKKDPTIYISAEAMQFECTKARVYEHELKHHNIEVIALNRLPQFMKDQGYKRLMGINNFIGSEQALNAYMSDLLNQSVADVSRFLQANTNHHHDYLDSNSNYEKEMLQCSTEENKMLNTLIRNGQYTKGIVKYDGKAKDLKSGYFKNEPAKSTPQLNNEVENIQNNTANVLVPQNQRSNVSSARGNAHQTGINQPSNTESINMFK